MSRIFSYTIPSDFEGKKISEFLHSKGFSDQVLTMLRHHTNADGIEIPTIFLADKPVHMNEKLNANDHIFVHLPDEESERVLPVEIELDILFEDEDILVINKPAGLPSHPSRANNEKTLGNAVAFHCKQHGSPIVFRCINRLDKDTSGLTVIAKNIVAAGILGQARLAGDLKRTYTAIVYGSPAPVSGTIDLPIEREKEDSIKRCVDFVNGKKAVTHYRMLNSLRYIDGMPLAIIELNLDTGRTHQIRVHMSHVGHPLIGDKIYNSSESTGLHLMNRHALHAGHLEFTHPISRKKMCFDAPLPADMQRFIN